MDNESKKPCAPVEEEGRDTTTVFREEDPLCAALDDFCYGRTQFTLREAKAIQAVFEGRTLDYLFEEKE